MDSETHCGRCGIDAEQHHLSFWDPAGTWKWKMVSGRTVDFFRANSTQGSDVIQVNMRYDTRQMKRFSLLLLLASFATAYAAQVGGDRNVEELQRQYQNPPEDSRIMMRWWWFGPAVTTPQLERDMRHMKEGGIGGFEVQPVYPLELDNEATGIKNLPFLSDEFLSALRFTAGKARELGLRFDLTLGSGWPYGGATVPVSQASARLRVERVAAAGSSVPLPRMNAGETLIAAFAVDAQGGAREITDIRNSAVSLPTDSGATSVQFFISSRTGMRVKRPAVGAEGRVVNHLDRAALDSY